MKNQSPSMPASPCGRLATWGRLAIFLLASLWSAGPLGAVEVSLEENKAERGNIGFVDLQMLFKTFPETLRARQNFEEVVRQAEDQVNVKRAELIGLRAELARLRMEREILAQSPPPIPYGPPAPDHGATTVAPSTSPVVSASTSAVTTSTTTVEASTTTVGSAEVPPGPPLIINLPGLTPDSAVVRAPGSSPKTLLEMDQLIEEKSRVLQEKESEFKTYQSQVEKNLLELESRRTEILLGRIYGAVRTVAREEGVSVVVDKSQILYGHTAVDLTPKILQRLKSL